jgi:hypothetical protein
LGNGSCRTDGRARDNHNDRKQRENQKMVSTIVHQGVNPGGKARVPPTGDTAYSVVYQATVGQTFLSASLAGKAVSQITLAGKNACPTVISCGLKSFPSATS